MADTSKRRPRHTPRGRCRECGKPAEPHEGFVCDECYFKAVLNLQAYFSRGGPDER